MKYMFDNYVLSSKQYGFIKRRTTFFTVT